MKEIAKQEAIEGLEFKIVEMGGTPVKRLTQKSNPTATPGCSNKDCISCAEERGRGGPCLKPNIQYELECAMCPELDKCIYIGESSRNLYTRSKEHVDKYKSKKRRNESFIKKHQVEKHNDRPAKFRARVTGQFNDCLSRQVSEGVEIRRSDKTVLNSKSEWHQPALWKVQNEVVRE